MPAIIEVKYFNTFLLKKVNDYDQSTGNALDPVWDGSRGIPQSLGGYPRTATVGADGYDWAIEESRIRGGYNNTSVSFGVKAYLVESEPNGAIRGNAMIYSGIYNSRTGINDTNVFSVGEEITKAADPANGSIQKLYAEDTNLIIFQENKVSRALIDKDAIYTAEGGGVPVSQLNLVIGQIVPYAGNYGISRNPESFAVYGYRKYFADMDRNAILRLSRDGITEISNYGMFDYFRDNLSLVNQSDAQLGKIVGGWDMYQKQYVVSMQQFSNPTFPQSVRAPYYQTLAFDERVLGWTSRFSYRPLYMFSLKGKFYSVGHKINLQGRGDGVYLWEHNVGDRAKFYDKQYQSQITFVFNPKVSVSKNFKTVNYEGSNGWEVLSYVSDETGPDEFNDDYINYLDTVGNPPAVAAVSSFYEGEYVINPADGQAVDRVNYLSVFGTVNPALPREYAGFDRKENKYYANLVNDSAAQEGEIIFGADMTGIKGYYCTVTISTDQSTDVGGVKELFAVSSDYVESAY